MELGELAGMKKVDVETVESFISRTDDKFRQTHGVNVESHPRTNIIVGTTNSESGFLRDITGNRRFWPVRVTEKGKYHAWELKGVDQGWAEAIVKYRDGEELFLKGKVAAKAYVQQQQAMESHDREGKLLIIKSSIMTVFKEKICFYNTEMKNWMPLMLQDFQINFCKCPLPCYFSCYTNYKNQ